MPHVQSPGIGSGPQDIGHFIRTPVALLILLVIQSANPVAAVEYIEMTLQMKSYLSSVK